MFELKSYNLPQFFSIPTSATSAVMVGENPYNFVKAHTASDILLITIGDSWIWGDDLPQKKRTECVFGQQLANMMSADLLNLGAPGAGNWHIVKKLQELLNISNKLEYKKIVVISVLTETARDFDSDSDRNIDYRSWLLNNIKTPDDYYNFLEFINQHIAVEIANSFKEFDSRFQFYVTSNFVDLLGFDVLNSYLLDKTWLQSICKYSNIKYQPDRCHLVSPWIIEKFEKVFTFAPELDRTLWLTWINQITEHANTRASVCHNDRKNFYKLMHPTEQHHKNFADEVFSYLQKDKFYEIKLENDQLLNVHELVGFCVRNQNQNIVLRVNNEGHCLENAGVYKILDMFKFNSVKIITFNKLEKHNLYNIDNSMWDSWLTNIESFDYNYNYEWDEQYIFGAIYGRPSAARLGIAGHLARYHSSKSLIKTKFDFDNENSRILFDLERLFSWDQSALSNVDLINNNHFFSAHEYQRGHYTQSNNLSHLYKNFLIDIIVEPVYSGKSFYPTEKIVRAILCKRPFIVMAPRNYLDYLHQLGFHTFGEFWDEDYDGFESKDRYTKILQVIDALTKMPKSKILDFYYSMTYYLDHNYKLLTDKSYNRNIRLIP